MFQKRACLRPHLLMRLGHPRGMWQQRRMRQDCCCEHFFASTHHTLLEMCLCQLTNKVMACPWFFQIRRFISGNVDVMLKILHYEVCARYCGFGGLCAVGAHMHYIH